MLQKTIIIGNLGGDPEMRYMPDGTAVTNFSVATNRRWTDRQSGEPVSETVWFRVSIFGKQAEACNQYLKKGRQVYAEGRLRVDPNTGGPKVWTRDDGTVSATFELQAFVVNFLGSKDGDNDGGSAAPASSSAHAEITPMEEDEIPF